MYFDFLSMSGKNSWECRMRGWECIRFETPSVVALTFCICSRICFKDVLHRYRGQNLQTLVWFQTFFQLPGPFLRSLIWFTDLHVHLLKNEFLDIWIYSWMKCTGSLRLNQYILKQQCLCLPGCSIHLWHQAQKHPFWFRDLNLWPWLSNLASRYHSTWTTGQNSVSCICPFGCKSGYRKMHTMSKILLPSLVQGVNI